MFWFSMDNQWFSSWARFFPNKIIRIIRKGQFTILSLLKIGMKKMEYKTRKWHDKCFQCVVCKTQVGSKPFIIPNETDVYCVGCFEEKFATKCTKCKKIMTTGGVTFKNEVWSISGDFFDNERLDSLDRQWGCRWSTNPLGCREDNNILRDDMSP